MSSPRLLLITAIATSSVAAAGAPALPDLPQLLAKLGQKESKNQRLIKSVVAENQLEEIRGNRLPHTRVDVDVTIANRNGRKEAQITKYLHDGRYFGSERLSLERRDFILAALGFAGNPFALDQQPNYRFTILARGTDEPSKMRIGFGPKKQKSSDIFTGEAIVDVETANVVSLQLHPSQLPTGVVRLDATIEFGAQSPLGSVPSKMVIEQIGDGFAPDLSSLGLSPSHGAAIPRRERLRLSTTYSQYSFTNSDWDPGVPGTTIPFGRQRPQS